MLIPAPDPKSHKRLRHRFLPEIEKTERMRDVDLRARKPSVT